MDDHGIRGVLRRERKRRLEARLCLFGQFIGLNNRQRAYA
jgi:hypothetical protein